MKLVLSHKFLGEWSADLPYSIIQPTKQTFLFLFRSIIMQFLAPNLNDISDLRINFNPDGWGPTSGDKAVPLSQQVWKKITCFGDLYNNI